MHPDFLVSRTACLCVGARCLLPGRRVHERYPIVMAGAETLHRKAAFRRPWRKQCCLVLADGGDEWKMSWRTKFPHFFRVAQARPLHLHRTLQGPGLRRRPKGSMHVPFSQSRAPHRPDDPSRMPIIVKLCHVEHWLNPEIPPFQPFTGFELRKQATHSRSCPSANESIHDVPAGRGARSRLYRLHRARHFRKRIGRTRGRFRMVERSRPDVDEKPRPRSLGANLARSAYQNIVDQPNAP
ncbi:MAG: hypothetical protein D6690_08645 [Nitrospirae bacterium]|nr:MAG: hypothetical protein D6690_08645 [Nitrospirota bacterium]